MAGQFQRYDNMNDDSRAISDPYLPDAIDLASETCSQVIFNPVPDIPDYLHDTYWWAYLHPKSIWIFEREWVVNLILS